MKIELEIEKPYWWLLSPCISLGISRNGFGFCVELLGISLQLWHGYCISKTLPYIAVTFGNVFYNLEFDLYLTKEYHWGYACWRKKGNKR